jgi:hypothetical protein
MVENSPSPTSSGFEMRYTYVMYVQPDRDGLFKAKIGSSNSVEFSGSDATMILQSILTELGRNDKGGSLFIKRPKNDEPFDLATEVTMPKGSQNIIIESDGAELRRIENLGCIINTNKNTGVKIFKGLRINGNNPAPTGNTGTGAPNKGICINGGSNTIVEDCYFTLFSNVHPVAAANSNNVILQRNQVGQCGGFGSEGGCSNLQIINNYFFAPGMDYPLVAAGNLKKNTEVVITGNQIPFGSSNGGGIDVVASNATISNNYVKDAYQHSIYVHDNYGYGGKDDPTNITISSNRLIGGGNSNLGGNSITLQSGNNSVDNNVHITNNYCDKGIGLTNAKKIIITNNILNRRIYVIRGQRFIVSANQIYAGTNGALAVEPNTNFAPILDKLVFTNNILEVGANTTRAIFPTGAPTNLVNQNNLTL